MYYYQKPTWTRRFSVSGSQGVGCKDLWVRARDQIKTSHWTEIFSGDQPSQAGQAHLQFLLCSWHSLKSSRLTQSDQLARSDHYLIWWLQYLTTLLDYNLPLSSLVLHYYNTILTENLMERSHSDSKFQPIFHWLIQVNGSRKFSWLLWEVSALVLFATNYSNDNSIMSVVLQ